MKKLIILILIGMGILPSLAQSNEILVPLSEPTKRGKLTVNIHYGSITVKGLPRKDVLVKYVEVDEDDNEDDDEEETKPKSKEGLKRISGGSLDIEVTEDKNEVTVESGSWSKKLNFTIEIPSGFDLNLSTYNDGDVTVSNIQGAIEISDYNGSITAENISGSVLADSYNGEIKVVFGKLTDATPMSFSTYNGDIDLTLPGTTKATFKMKTEQGEVLSSFDMNVIKNKSIQKKDTKGSIYKVVVDDWVKGEVNGGGPEFTLKNYNGNIIIRKK
jgi:hypothetical protein